jgi:cell division protein FtsB
MLTKIKAYQENLVRRAAGLRDVRVLGLGLFLVIVLLITWSGVKAIDANYDLQKQISKLEQQNAVKKMANENLRLQNAYYDTPQGETVLVVPKSVALAHTVDLPPTVPVSAKARQEAKKPFYQRNFDAWMDFFLHRRAAED